MPNWDRLVADNGSTVWRILWRLLGERADVEDCFQETFVAAVRIARREKVDCWPAALSRLATARGLDRLRQRYRHQKRQGADACRQDSKIDEQSYVPCHSAGPIELAIASELSERLRKALSQLSAEQAEAFSLFALSGWTHRELSERMQMSENAIGVLLHRARQRLQSLLRVDPLT